MDICFKVNWLSVSTVDLAMDSTLDFFCFFIFFVSLFFS